MASGFRLSFQCRLYLLVLFMSLAVVVSFLIFQYNRELQYKAESLDAQLQIYNTHLIDELESGSGIEEILKEDDYPLPELRVSVIDEAGSLVFDNGLDSLNGLNHLDRPEIRKAITSGSGFTTRRHSESADRTYFYSAMKRGQFIVRTAVPYSVSLDEVLRADRTFLWFMCVITIIVGVAGYFVTRRFARTIHRLNDFAAQAERGERVYNVEPFPNDELGSISNHIIRLYARLQQTVAERDREHLAALHEEKERIRIKKQLTNNINHELKTPVAAIKVCLETVLEHRNLPKEKLWEFIEKSYSFTERLTALLNDVSAITRLDDGAANIEMEQLVLNDIVTEVAEEERDRLSNAGMELQVMVPGDIELMGNRSFLESVFRNLIDNSIAYSHGSKILIKAEEVTSSLIRISFIDDGTGIPDEHIERIFERFYRIDKGRSRQAGGTGLGLSIVKNAVMLHGGNITARNLKPKGLEFVFTLCRNPKCGK